MQKGNLANVQQSYETNIAPLICNFLNLHLANLEPFSLELLINMTHSRY